MDQIPLLPESGVETSRAIALRRAPAMTMGGDFAQAESGHTVRSLLAILRRRKGIILSCVLFVTAATAVVAAMLPHSYVAEFDGHS